MANGAPWERIEIRRRGEQRTNVVRIAIPHVATTNVLPLNAYGDDDGFRRAGCGFLIASLRPRAVVAREMRSESRELPRRRALAAQASGNRRSFFLDAG